ncbi:TK protein kinase [Salpingoeca rosetta]|uniref:TK protein kinase n=1 Tax=Salpingoeca rosetta (strain ATCC 50818 / BSB-021) TaxID=946362 RepID=F2UHN1_SALR5|nr:TK protein kinase [Salpingoeca rosetta]EGD76630.1 TK protein kinase [Salpingoeca rosetta]|eukprot:XP_004991544.1 TK protein kinase [Salpingoeca rosetta]
MTAMTTHTTSLQQHHRQQQKQQHQKQQQQRRRQRRCTRWQWQRPIVNVGRVLLSLVVVPVILLDLHSLVISPSSPSTPSLLCSAACPESVPGFAPMTCPDTTVGAACALSCPANPNVDAQYVCASLSNGDAWVVQGSTCMQNAICALCTCSESNTRVSCDPAVVTPNQLAGISPTVTHVTIATQDTLGTNGTSFQLPAHLLYALPQLLELRLENQEHFSFDNDAAAVAQALARNGQVAPGLQVLAVTGAATGSATALDDLLRRVVPGGSTCPAPAAAGLTVDLRGNGAWLQQQPLPWRRLQRATHVILDNNALVSLEVAAADITDCCLRSVSALHNAITTLDLAELGDCEQLAQLHLRNNSLTHLHAGALNQEPLLTFLDIRDNNIALVDTFAFDLSFSRYSQYWSSIAQALHMSGNPSVCTLQLEDGERLVMCACANGYTGVPSCLDLQPIACPDGNGTVMAQQLCDGVQDCADGWDEQQCTAHLVAYEDSPCSSFHRSEPCEITCRGQLFLTTASGHVTIESHPNACDNCAVGLGSIADDAVSSGISSWTSLSFEVDGGFVRVRSIVPARDGDEGPVFVLQCNELYRVVGGSWLGLNASVSATASLSTATSSQPSSSSAPITPTPLATLCPDMTSTFRASHCSLVPASTCTPDCINSRIAPFPITCTATGAWSADPCADVGDDCGGAASLTRLSPSCSNLPSPNSKGAAYCNVTCTDEEDAVALCTGDSWSFFCRDDPDVELSCTGDSLPASSSSSLATGSIIGIVIGVLVLTLVAAVIVTVMYRRRQAATAAALGLLDRHQSRVMHELERCNVVISQLGGGSKDWRHRIQHIDRSSVSLQEELGRGAFGVVRKGIWTNKKGVQTSVAVKMMAGSGASLEEQASFLVEAHIMAVLSHPCLVQVLGVVTGDSAPPLIVVELMRNGNLRDFLRARATINPCPLTWGQLLDVCISIADGMAFLASNNIVHRDLACRNVLVGESIATVKISDYGMARYLMQADYYRMTSDTALPMAWMAPESVKDNKWSIASDVWSCGVTFWEVVSLGETPFSGLSLPQIPHAQSAVHRYLPAPPTLPHSIYDVMKSCWTIDPDTRPTCNHVLARLTAIRETLGAAATAAAVPLPTNPSTSPSPSPSSSFSAVGHGGRLTFVQNRSYDHNSGCKPLQAWAHDDAADGGDDDDDSDSETRL